ncbi:MI domain-containing protein [Plasmodiophora brassicae]|nr:hypothetical protein PBRA_002163 [Plasmodiophora brassicae]
MRSSWRGSPRGGPQVQLSRNRSLVRRHVPKEVDIDDGVDVSKSRNALVLAAAAARADRSTSSRGADNESGTNAPQRRREQSQQPRQRRGDTRDWRDRSQPPRAKGGRYDENKPKHGGLHQSDNKWKMDKSSRDECEQAESAILVILNKLTPETFMKLSDQAATITVTGAETLERLCAKMFEKAIDEASFASMYAQFIARLSAKLPTFRNEDGQQIDVRSTIITRCYHLLTQGPDRTHLESLQEPELSEEQQKIKSRQTGNVILMGELFKHGLLAEHVVHVSIEMLLTNWEASQSVDDVESLIPFIQTVGSFVDKQSPAKMDEYFGRITSMSKSKSLLPRLRFMLMDLIDLRRNRWRLRREKVVDPKMLDDVRKQNDKSTSPWSSARQPTKRFAGPPPAMRPAILRPPSKPAPWAPKQTNQRPSFSWGSIPHDMRGQDDGDEHDDEPEAEAPEQEEPETTEANDADNEVDDEVSRKVDALVREYYSCDDVDEALLCVREIGPAGNRLVVRTAIAIAFDMKDSNREQLRTFLAVLLDKEIIPASDMLAAISALLEEFDDIAIDIPRAPLYLANVLGDLVGDGSLPFADVVAMLRNTTTTQALGMIALDALARIKAKHGGEEKLHDIWTKVDVSEFKRLFQPKQLMPTTFKHNLEAKGLLCLPI